MPINQDNRYRVWYPGGSNRGVGGDIGFTKYKKDAIELALSYSDPYIQIWDTQGYNLAKGQSGCEIPYKRPM